MKMREFRLFIPIQKIDEERHEVIGRATVEELDAQGEIVEFAGSKRAFEAWTKKFEKATGGLSLGNIREMHQAIAAGKVIAWDADADSKAIELACKVVDEAAWEKVKERVYTGYSIGGRATRQKKERRDGKLVNVVKDYVLSEVSLVDNPASPSSTFTMVKGNGDGFRPIPMRRFRDEAKDETPLQKATRMISALQKGELIQKPAIVDACVADLMAQGHDESSAFAICSAAQEKLGKDATKEALVKEALVIHGEGGGDGKRAIHTISFAKDRFPQPADAERWLKANGFTKTEITIHDAEKCLNSEQRPVTDFADDGSVIHLGKGVDAIVMKLRTSAHASKASPAMAKVLGRIKKNLISEGPSIFAGMRALEGVLSAIDSEMGPAAFDPNAVMPDEEKAAVADLTEVATALLEFMRGEFDQQLRAITGAGAAAAVPAATEILEQFQCLAEVLTTDQIARLGKQEEGEEEDEDAEELMENLGKIHKIGHSLVDATTEMGAECPDGVCKQEEETDEEREEREKQEAEDEEREAREKQEREDETDEEREAREKQEAEDEEEEKRGKSAKAGKRPAAEGAEMRKVAAGIAKVIAKVDEVKTVVDGFDKRLKKVERLPAPIGRSVTARNKAIGAGGAGGGEGDERTMEHLQKMAAKEPDPRVKETLLKEAATLSTRQVHREAYGRE